MASVTCSCMVCRSCSALYLRVMRNDHHIWPRARFSRPDKTMSIYEYIFYCIKKPIIVSDVHIKHKASITEERRRQSRQLPITTERLEVRRRRRKLKVKEPYITLIVYVIVTVQLIIRKIRLAKSRSKLNGVFLSASTSFSHVCVSV